MKVLIVGSTGMLGNTFKQYLDSVECEYETLNRSDVDLSTCSWEELEEKIIEKDCDVLINCAGLIKQRKGITTADFVAVNSLLPHRMAEICYQQNMKMIHITTDCVYDGEYGNYKESVPHNVNDDYGKSKSMGEPENCTVIRTSIIGEEETNKLSLLEWVKSNKEGEINGYKNHIWNGVTCLQLSKIIIDIINKNIFWTGTRHIFSNQVTKYDLVKIINEIYKLNIKITPINDKISVNRTLDTIYDIDEFNIPNLYKQIEEINIFYNNIRYKKSLEYYEKLI